MTSGGDFATLPTVSLRPETNIWENNRPNQLLFSQPNCLPEWFADEVGEKQTAFDNPLPAGSNDIWMTDDNAPSAFLSTSFAAAFGVRLRQGAVGCFGCDTGRGKQPMQWRVLKILPEKVLLISEQSLFEMPFAQHSEGVRWESSMIRKVLNDGFMRLTFTPHERQQIEVLPVQTHTSKAQSTAFDKELGDCLFLLSNKEAKHYFASDLERASSLNGIPRGWWLRTPGEKPGLVRYVDCFGSIVMGGFEATGTAPVRPAFWFSPVL